MPTIRTPSHGAAPPTRRKRSSPTAAGKEPLTRASSSSSSLVYPVPTSIAWLEQLTLSIDTTNHKKKRSDVRYVLTVEHTKSKTAWTHVRTFDDYRQFQKRLQKALRHGHFCHAECPWLFTYVKSYFPKPCVIGAILAANHVMEQRREKLHMYFQTLQSFLLNRGNHCCSVLTTAVADELMAFVNGDEGVGHQERLGFSTTPCSSTSGSVTNVFATTSRKSWDSNSGSDADDASGGEEVRGSDMSEMEHEGMCRLCNSRLEGEAYADSPCAGPVVPVVVASPAAEPTSLPTPVSSTEASSPAASLPSPLPLREASCQTLRHTVPHNHYYTTRLTCGHQFHDECIVPKLNESMHCPICGQEEKR